MKFNPIALTASALLAASLATASSQDISGVDRLLMVTRGHQQVSAEKRALLAEQYARDHPESFDDEETAAALSRRQIQAGIASRAHKRANKKRCKAKTSQAALKDVNTTKVADTQAVKSSSNKQSTNSKTSSQNKQAQSHQSESKSSNDKSSNDDSSSSSSSSSGSKTFSATGGSAGKMGSLKFAGACSSSGADGSKPNGQNWFLTCGVSKNNPNSVWNPPKVAMSDLKMISSEEAASSSVFKPCAQYKSAFESAAKATGVPVVLLMSFALQESTCQAGQTGPNGEIGLMQITPEKCPSSGNCKDPYTNVMTGAKYFKSQLDSFGGDVLKATGSYNGWQPGKLSYSSTMAMKQYGCAAQQNLDYLDALFNGYCQGKDGSSSQFKSFNNLAACG